VKIMSQTLGKRIFLINRIDRPVSGLVLMGLRPRIQKAYSSYIIIKKYIAVVHKSESLKAGTYEHHHSKNAHRMKAYISDESRKDSKPVTLDIEQVHQLDNYTALIISIRSGRFHQIRAQMAHLGAPIKGDVKYGARRAHKDRSIMLHAYEYNCHETEQRFTAMPEPSSLWDESIAGLGLAKTE
jgi:23S rRNA pseudouridine1911/1915/1917 synthase